MNAVQAPQAKNTSSDFVTKGGKLAGPLGKQSVDSLQKLPGFVIEKIMHKVDKGSQGVANAVFSVLAALERFGDSHHRQ